MEDTASATISGATNVVTRTIDVNGTAVTYYDAGTPDPKHPPVVMVHGASGSTQGHFGYLFPMLSVRQRVISLDLANPVTGDEKLTLEMLEAQVLAVIADAVPGQKITLLGFSMGSAIAAFTAARHPEIVENLVLIAGWMKTDMHMVLFSKVWHALRKSGAPEIDDFTIFGAFGTPFLSTKTREEMAPGAMPMSEFIDKQMAMNVSIDISDLVPSITARTLIISCTHDLMVPIHHGRQLFGTIEDSRFAEVNSGHACVFERAAEVLRLVEHFAADPGGYPAGTIIPQIKP